MDEELKTYLMQMEQRLFNHIVSHVDESIERVETKLLTEFQKWASPTDARLRTHSAALRAIDLEMEALTDRVQKLEGEKPRQ